MATYNKTYEAVIPTMELIIHDLLTFDATYEAVISTNELVVHDLAIYGPVTEEAIVPTNELIVHDLLIHSRTMQAIITTLERTEPAQNIYVTPPLLVIATLALIVPSWEIETGPTDVPILAIAGLSMQVPTWSILDGNILFFDAPIMGISLAELKVPSWEILEGTTQFFTPPIMVIAEAEMLVPSWEVRDFTVTFEAPIMEIVSMQNNVTSLRFQVVGKIEVLYPRGSKTALEGTDSTNVIYEEDPVYPITMETDDFIVNMNRRTHGLERGSRLVASGNSSSFTLDDAIVGQTEGDNILLFKYIEIMGRIKPESIEFIRRVGGQSELKFTYIGEVQYEPEIQLYAGQYIRANFSDIEGFNNQVFKGILYSINKRTIVNGKSANRLIYECVARGYNTICGRRSIKCEFDEGETCGNIVASMVANYLYQEGIKSGTIDAGATLSEDWQEDTLSISEILDQCAARSGYQWFIDDDGYLQFYQDPNPIPEALHNIDVDEGTFRDFTNFTYDETIDGYFNKTFVVGGSDILGNIVSIGVEDYSEAFDLQESVAGSGIYGNIIRDSSITDAEYFVAGPDSVSESIINLPAHGLTTDDLPQSVYNVTRNLYSDIVTVSDPDEIEIIPSMSGLTAGTEFNAEAGTDTENIKITSHGQAVGNIIYNANCAEYRIILAITSADIFVVDAISGQTTADVITMNGDVIVLYQDCSRVIRNSLKKQGVIPISVSFRTKSIVFNPGEKIRINNPYIGIVDKPFLIEEVRITFPTGKKDTLFCDISCVARKEDSFSTQRRDSFLEYFGGL